MECSVKCFKHIYTCTGACFYWRYAQDDYSRRHKVCDGPELHCWHSPKEHCRTWCTRIQTWLQRGRIFHRSAAANRSAPSASKLPLLALSHSCCHRRLAGQGLQKLFCPYQVTASLAVPWVQTFLEGALELGQWCRQSLTEVPAVLPVEVSGERAQAAAGVWIQAHLQALQAEMLQLPEEPWALSTQCGSKAEQGPLSARSTALLPLPNGQHWTAGEFLRLFTPLGYFCNQLYFMTVNTNCCGRAGRSWWHLQER